MVTRNHFPPPARMSSASDHEQAVSVLPRTDTLPYDLQEYADRDALVVVPYPKRLVDNLHGTALRFGQVKLVDERTHMNAVVMSQFLLSLLSKGSFAHDVVEHAYVHDASDVVVFYLCLRLTKSVNDFERKAWSMLQAHAQLLELQDEQPAPQGATAAGSKQGAGFKRPRLSSNAEAARTLRQARLELKRSVVPAHMYAATTVMCRPLTWSLCVTCREDWDYVAGHFVAHLLCGISNDVVIHEVRKLVGQAPQQQAAADGQGAPPPLPAPPPPVDDDEGGMDDADDDGDEAMQDASVGAPAAQAVAPAGGPVAPPPTTIVIKYSVAGVDKEFRFNPSFETMFGGSGLTGSAELRRLITGKARLDAFPGDPAAMWQLHDSAHMLEAPAADLSSLSTRCLLARPDMFSAFFTFASKQRYDERNANVANRTGDLALLDGFFGSAQRVNTHEDRRDAARLVFDLCVRKNGYVPKAWHDTIAAFISYLSVSGNKLMPFGEADDEEACAMKSFKRYENLTYTGNFVVSMLDLFEQLGTYNFHVEQLMIFIQSSSVTKRPKRLVGDSQPGMAIHMLNYGPPGVGKSNATELFLDACEQFCKRNSYSSLRSMYTNLPNSDYANGKLVVHDEAPPWITDNMSKSNNNNEEYIQQQKEKLSSGRMVGERYVSFDTKGGGAGTASTSSKTILFNVDVPNAPVLMNTNACEKNGDRTLYDRFVPRYMMFETRAVPHHMQKGVVVDVDALKRLMQRHLCVDMSLLMLASELQSIGVLSTPNTLPFYAFMDTFLKELKECPFLDDAPIDAGSRRAQVIELIFVILVMHSAIHALFLDEKAPRRNEPFDIEMLLELEELMAAGDTQAAIFAVSFYSHFFRSPTEYRAAELIGALIKSNAVLERQSRQSQQAAANAAGPAGPGGAPGFSMGFHPAGPAAPAAAGAVLPMQTDDDEDAPITWRTPSDEGRKALDRAPARLKLALFGNLNGSSTPLYTFVCTLDCDGKHYDIARALAAALPKSNGATQLMDEHLVKRLSILLNLKCKCGPLKGSNVLHSAYDRVTKTVDVYVLNAWMEDCLETHEFSLFNMIKRAVFANRSSPPGTYLVLEALNLDKHKDTLSCLPDGAVPLHRRVGAAVPNLLPCFQVPLHATDCNAWNDEDMETYRTGPLPRVFVEGLHSSPMCNCFRSRGVLTSVNGERVRADSHTLALAQHKSKTPSGKAYALPFGGPKVYPRHALAQVFAAAGAPTVTERDTSAAERSLQSQQMYGFQGGPFSNQNENEY